MRVSRRDSVDRYYLFGLFGWGVFIHHIKQSDPAEVMHTHPWSWLSIILGAYEEDRPGQPRRVRRLWNFCRAGVPHRVVLRKPVWTLLIHGPRRVRWCVMDGMGAKVLEVEPWTGTDNPNRTGYAR